MGFSGLTNCTYSEQDPWAEIYNGKDTDGWEIRDGFAEAWVEEGPLLTQQIDSLNFTYLVYKEQLSDFIMECDVKLSL